MKNQNKQLKISILKNLKTNGFPDRKVSLPLDQMYEIADNKGANLNIILEDLNNEGIKNTKKDDKIIFEQLKTQKMSQEALMSQAQEMMGQMTPEQLKKIQDQFSNMTSEQKDDLMVQAKKMGLT